MMLDPLFDSQIYDHSIPKTKKKEDLVFFFCQIETIKRTSK